MPNFKLIIALALIVGAFFFGRSTGIDKVTVKCQAKEVKQAHAVVNATKNVIANRPVNRAMLVNRLRTAAKAKRAN